MCVIVGASKINFRQLWMQDIVFLTPGGVRYDAPLGYRHVTTTIAVECAGKTDLYVTFAGEVEDFCDAHESLRAAPDDGAGWVNQVTNHGGLRSLRELRLDEEEGSFVSLTFHDQPTSGSLQPHSLRSLAIQKIAKTEFWPDGSEDRRIRKALTDAGLELPFSTITIKDMPQGKFIIRYSVKVKNRVDYVAAGGTSFDLLGAKELKADIEGTFVRMLGKVSAASAASDARKEDALRNAYDAATRVFGERTNYGPGEIGVYDAIVCAYPGCTVETTLGDAQNQRSVGAVLLPWANPRVGGVEKYLGSRYTSTGGSFRLHVAVRVPQGCEHWEYPANPTCSSPPGRIGQPGPRFMPPHKQG